MSDIRFNSVRYAAYRLLVNDSQGNPTYTVALTNGQLAIGSTGAAPVIANLTAGSGVSIVNGAGSITVSATGSGGTVTSVALADGSTTPIYSVTGSPVTTNGTLTFTLNTESANTVFAGPSTGSAAQPTFRALAATDLPKLTFTALTGPTTYNIVAADNGTVFACNTTSGTVTLVLPAASSGFHFYVKDPLGTWGTNNTIIQQHSSENIENVAASKILQTPYAAEHFISGTTNWHML